MKAGVNDEKRNRQEWNADYVHVQNWVALLQIPTKISKTEKNYLLLLYFFLQFPLLRIIVQVNEIPNVKIRSFVYLITFAVYVQKR